MRRRIYIDGRGLIYEDQDLAGAVRELIDTIEQERREAKEARQRAVEALWNDHTP